MRRIKKIVNWLALLVYERASPVVLRQTEGPRGVVLAVAWSFPLFHLAVPETGEPTLDPDFTSTGEPRKVGRAVWSDEAAPLSQPRVRQGPPLGHPEKMCFSPPTVDEMSLWWQISAEEEGASRRHEPGRRQIP